MAKNVLVVGMPRSGTSMTAGALARAGYHAADEASEELRGGDEGNPGGYWEAQPLIDRNVEVFAAAGFPHHNTWLFDPISDPATARLSSLKPLPAHQDFVQKQSGVEPWMWKDPRLCYTLGYWWQFLDPEETVVVLTLRSWEAIYNSFLRLGWRERSPEAEADVKARVAAHIEFARRTIDTHRIPFLDWDYDESVRDPETAVKRLSAFVDHPIDVSHLGASTAFNHSTFTGRVRTRVQRGLGQLPAGIRGPLKALAPRRAIELIFPERKQR